MKSYNAGVPAFKSIKSLLQKLVAAVNEGHEWKQVFVLDTLARRFFMRQKGLLSEGDATSSACSLGRCAFGS
ncbi:hypothetical protein DD238_002805 [Peronospora effusa]|uniref:Uncharacterized protein n=1 Tax=Peronospora effusa TaxID=542832 RepID=A0A3M6VRZ1_9STRA|nr:hypothetical protein DD238_002805 [Peronospora effusa]